MIKVTIHKKILADIQISQGIKIRKYKKSFDDLDFCKEAKEIEWRKLLNL